MLFALADCAEFYCSCERVFDPSLRGRPVAVLSNNDGCVIARSAELKPLGIPMGAPYFKWHVKLKAAGAAVFSSNYALYADMSRRVMQTLETFTPDVEVYSIDEAFLAFDAQAATAADRARLGDLAREVHRRVLRWTGIPIRVALAPTKTLAKVGVAWARGLSDAGQEPAVFLPPPGPALDAILNATPVDEVWGIGRRWAPRLHAAGVTTALDLRDRADGWVRKLLHAPGLRLVYELRGVSCLPVERLPPTRKSLVRSRSFGEAVTTVEPLRQALASHAARAAEKLRAEGLYAGALHAFVTTKGHGPGPHLHAAQGVPLHPCTDQTPALIKAAVRALDACYRPATPDGRPYRYKKAGVVLSELTPARQAHLFAPEAPAADALLEAVDRLNRRFGPRTVFFAQMGTRPRGQAPPWAMQRAHPHLAFSTRWSDLPVVLATKGDAPEARASGA